MGVFKAAGSAVGGVLADQWLEYFYCDDLSADLLAKKAAPHKSERSANTKGSSGVISSGSVIAVADGQCAIAVEAGKVLGVYTEPGENRFHSKRSGGIFSGDIGGLVRQTIDRIGFGGDAALEQSIIYLNLKEIPGNPFAFTRIINVKSADGSFSLDLSVSMAGVFSFRISDPLKFYKEICRSRVGTVTVSDVLPQLTEEFAAAAAAALADQCAEGLSLPALAEATEEICETTAARITGKWQSLRGFQVVSAAFDEIRLAVQDLSVLQQLEQAKALSDPALAAGYLAGAQADALRAASRNMGGAGMRGFLYNVPAQPKPTNPANPLLQNDPAAPQLWRCVCGSLNTTPFCEICGAQRPHAKR